MFYIIATFVFSPSLLIAMMIKKALREPERKRYLIYQTAKIGDVVCSTSIFEAIKIKEPCAHLAVVVSDVTEPLLRNNKRVDEIIVLGGPLGKVRTKLALIRRAFRGSYDVALVLVPNPVLCFVSIFSLIPDIVTIVPDTTGITMRLMSFFCKRVRHCRGEQVVKTYLNVLAAAGIEGRDVKGEMFYGPKSERKALDFYESNGIALGRDRCIGLILSAANKLKALPLENLLFLTKALAEEFESYVVLIGTKGDQSVSARIVDALGNKSVKDACGVFPLADLPALIARLDVVIGVDTGPVYIAHALNVPIVVMAGPCDMSERWSERADVKIVKNRCRCSPCSFTYQTSCDCRRGDRICITGIDPGDILTDVEGWLCQEVE